MEREPDILSSSLQTDYSICTLMWAINITSNFYVMLPGKSLTMKLWFVKFVKIFPQKHSCNTLYRLYFLVTVNKKIHASMVLIWFVEPYYHSLKQLNIHHILNIWSCFKGYRETYSCLVHSCTTMNIVPKIYATTCMFGQCMERTKKPPGRLAF